MLKQKIKGNAGQKSEAASNQDDHSSVPGGEIRKIEDPSGQTAFSGMA